MAVCYCLNLRPTLARRFVMIFVGINVMEFGVNAALKQGLSPNTEGQVFILYYSI